LINLDSLRELDQSAAPDFLTETRHKASTALTECEKLAAAVRGAIRGQLESALDS
jgi:hypothetical protein